MNKKYFHGSVSEQVSVSKDTIRRDLIRLEKEGHLKRTHGGAISVQSEATIYDYAQRIVKHPEKNKRLPKKFGQIFPNKRPFFDSSTTVEAAIRAMENSPIHAITNSLSHALLLAQMDQTKLQYYLGNCINNNSFCLGQKQSLRLGNLPRLYIIRCVCVI